MKSRKTIYKIISTIVIVLGGHTAVLAEDEPTIENQINNLFKDIRIDRSLMKSNLSKIKDNIQPQFGIDYAYLCRNGNTHAVNEESQIFKRYEKATSRQNLMEAKNLRDACKYDSRECSNSFEGLTKISSSMKLLLEYQLLSSSTEECIDERAELGFGYRYLEQQTENEIIDSYRDVKLSAQQLGSRIDNNLQRCVIGFESFCNEQDLLDSIVQLSGDFKDFISSPNTLAENIWEDEYVSEIKSRCVGDEVFHGVFSQNCAEYLEFYNSFVRGLFEFTIRQNKIDDHIYDL
ncbi:MAG: hypothetical protein HRU19_01885 [Pseudobacteriovorax sp.]|nr:hypothetical protein [Pseudobacteriovorax sp.]